MLSDIFCKQQFINTDYRKVHYQLTGSSRTRIASNVEAIVKLMEELDVSFGDSKFVCNVFSKAILPSTSSDEILNHKNIGEECYQLFVKERFHGTTSIWSSMKKRKLQTFKTSGKEINRKIGEKVIQLKEEKSLLSRFLIASRKRPELDLEHCLGNFEFSVVPKSLFSNDGEPLISTDKYVILHHIEDMLKPESSQDEIGHSDQSVIIIDGMAVVNKVKKTPSIKTLKVGVLFHGQSMVLKQQHQFNVVCTLISFDPN